MLITHVSDIKENLDLKIYEKDKNGKTIFECYVTNENTGEEVCLTLGEKIAALVYVGLGQIFTEDDSEYQTNEPKKQAEDILTDFFDYLNKCDKEHFEI